MPLRLVRVRVLHLLVGPSAHLRPSQAPREPLWETLCMPWLAACGGLLRRARLRPREKSALCCSKPLRLNHMLVCCRVRQLTCAPGRVSETGMLQNRPHAEGCPLWWRGGRLRLVGFAVRAKGRWVLLQLVCTLGRHLLQRICAHLTMAQSSCFCMPDWVIKAPHAATLRIHKGMRTSEAEQFAFGRVPASCVAITDKYTIEARHEADSEALHQRPVSCAAGVQASLAATGL